MRLKNVFVIIVFSLFLTSCSLKETVDNDVIEVEKKVFFAKKEIKREAINDLLLSEINYILFLLKQNDLETLNSRFINPKYGLYEIMKNPENNKIYFNKKLQIEEISDQIDSFDIKQEEVVFNCSPYDDAYYGWDKEGVFISANTKNYLSDIMKNTNLLIVNTYSAEELKVADFIEKMSYEVIISHNMTFYITKINKHWYITLIDKVISDCSE
ncbi:MAG: hypothetical protein EOM78_03465 [Erysipelotrichia bacterium]|nr:hypothetical protein [Erysipelotrichia bacterium]